MTTKPEPGARVRLTGAFLHNTGQYTGHDAHHTWTVLPCNCDLCKLGRHVAVDEPSSTQFTAAELTAEPGIANRHIAFSNLEPSTTK